MSNDDADEIGRLIALGFIVLAGVGLYAVLRAFGSHDSGDMVTKEELIEADSETGNEDKKTLCQEAEERSEDVCWECLTVNPSRNDCGHCRCKECTRCSTCLPCEGGGGMYCWSCNNSNDNND